MDLEILLGALCAVLVLFAWSEWRLGKMPQTEEEFRKHRTAEYLLLSGIFMIAGAALVFALKSGLLAVLIITTTSQEACDFSRREECARQLLRCGFSKCCA